MQNVAPAGRTRERCSSLTDTELSITQNQQVEDTGTFEDYDYLSFYMSKCVVFRQLLNIVEIMVQWLFDFYVHFLKKTLHLL